MLGLQFSSQSLSFFL